MKLKSRTFMAGDSMSQVSSPEARTGGGERFHVREYRHEALVEAEIAHARNSALTLTHQREGKRILFSEFLLSPQPQRLSCRTTRKPTL